MHQIKHIKYLKTEAVTVGRCTCGGFEVTCAGRKEAEVRRHLEFHLRRHGA